MKDEDTGYLRGENDKEPQDKTGLFLAKLPCAQPRFTVFSPRALICPSVKQASTLPQADEYTDGFFF